jgi:hypothetical protein
LPGLDQAPADIGFQIGARAKAEFRLSSNDVGQTVTRFTRLSGAMNRRKLGSQRLIQDCHKLIERSGLPRRDVEELARNTGSFRGKKVCLNHVFDIGKIPRLATVACDRGPSAALHFLQKTSDDGRVHSRGTLARPKDVEIAQTHRF